MTYDQFWRQVLTTLSDNRWNKTGKEISPSEKTLKQLYFLRFTPLQAAKLIIKETQNDTQATLCLQV